MGRKRTINIMAWETFEHRTQRGRTRKDVVATFDITENRTTQLRILKKGQQLFMDVIGSVAKVYIDRDRLAIGFTAGQAHDKRVSLRRSNMFTSFTASHLLDYGFTEGKWTCAEWEIEGEMLVAVMKKEENNENTNLSIS